MQLELFLTARPKAERPPVLARLTPEERRALVQTLARLLVETLHAKERTVSDER